MTTKTATYQFIQFISLIISGIGGLTIAGYVSNNPKLYAWSGAIPMALNSAICFVLVGMSIFLISRRLFYTVKP